MRAATWNLPRVPAQLRRDHRRPLDPAARPDRHSRLAGRGGRQPPGHHRRALGRQSAGLHLHRQMTGIQQEAADALARHEQGVLVAPWVRQDGPRLRGDRHARHSDAHTRRPQGPGRPVASPHQRVPRREVRPARRPGPSSAGSSTSPPCRHWPGASPPACSPHQWPGAPRDITSLGSLTRPHHADTKRHRQPENGVLGCPA